jgi:hypothetical protein
MFQNRQTTQRRLRLLYSYVVCILVLDVHIGILRRLSIICTGCEGTNETESQCLKRNLAINEPMSN